MDLEEEILAVILSEVLAGMVAVEIAEETLTEIVVETEEIIAEILTEEEDVLSTTHLDYFSQLWSPSDQANISNKERVARNFTSRVA